MKGLEMRDKHERVLVSRRKLSDCVITPVSSNLTAPSAVVASVVRQEQLC